MFSSILNGIDGQGYKRKLNLWGDRVNAAISKSISQSFTKSTKFIWISTVGTYVANFWLGQINWGF